jgi:hypothetical protein
MPASTNKRIYWAIEQVGIKEDGTNYTWGSGDEVHGVQSCGTQTNFNLRQVFQLGQLALYANIEEIPDVEVTLSKKLDGYPLMYHMATQGSTTTGPDLAGRSTTKCMFAMAIFPDTSSSANGTPPSIVACSGMFVGSVSFNIPLDDDMSEDITLVGNHKVWKNTSGHGATLATLPTPVFAGQFSGNNDSPIGQGGINGRQHLIFDYDGGEGLDVNNMVADPDATILPPEVHGISNSGTNEESNGQSFDAHLQSISVSAQFNRESINELGRKGPYARNIAFPVEVTCEISVTSTSGDMISATEDGIYTTGTAQCDNQGNLKDRTIRIATCEGTRIYLGTKNKLSGTSYSGGDAGGGNVTVTYTFTTYNDLTVIHSGDPHASGATWWTNRADYLVD